MELDVARPVGPEREHPDARPADRRGQRGADRCPARPRGTRRRARSRSARRRCRGASRRAPRSARAGRPRGRRWWPAAGTRRSRRRRCRPGRSSPTGRATGRTRARSGRAGTTRRRRRGRPARHRPPPLRARSTRRRRSRSRRGWTAAGSLARCRAASRPGRAPACCSRPTAAPHRATTSRERRTAGLRMARRGLPPPASHVVSAASAARSASSQSDAHAPDAARPSARATSTESASAQAVVTPSAWTNVVGRMAGSLQPPSPSTTTWIGSASVSIVSTGLDVGVAPNRITSSGRCASRQAPGGPGGRRG